MRDFVSEGGGGAEGGGREGRCMVGSAFGDIAFALVGGEVGVDYASNYRRCIGHCGVQECS